MARIDDIGSARRESGKSRPATAGQRPSVALVGISHRTTPFDVLASAAFTEDGARQALQRLQAEPEILEAAVIATCNRTEIYMVTPDRESAVGMGRELLRAAALPESAGIYVKYGREVITHLLRVAAGIDSMMVGEVQILGQVKHALAVAEEELTIGTILGKLFGKAFRAGKRARAETEIGQGAVSISYAALGLAQKIFSDLRELTLLVVGAGEASSLTARHFAEAGVGHLLIVNRTPARAAALAAEVGGRAVPFDQLTQALTDADIAVSATSAPTPIIDHSMVRTALDNRNKRRLVLIDIALPRDIEPRVNEFGNVFLHDMAALDSIVQRNLDRRRREIPKVESIIAEEVQQFENWQGSLHAGSTIRDLRRHFEQIRGEELAGLEERLGEEEFQLVERATRSMINKLLHQPQVGLRRPRTGSGGVQTLAAVVRELFRLDGGDATSGRRPAPGSLKTGSPPAPTAAGGPADATPRDERDTDGSTP